MYYDIWYHIIHIMEELKDGDTQDWLHRLITLCNSSTKYAAVDRVWSNVLTFMLEFIESLF